jgi:hypothetical protein
MDQNDVDKVLKHLTVILKQFIITRCNDSILKEWIPKSLSTGRFKDEYIRLATGEAMLHKMDCLMVLKLVKFLSYPSSPLSGAFDRYQIALLTVIMTIRNTWAHSTHMTQDYAIWAVLTVKQFLESFDSTLLVEFDAIMGYDFKIEEERKMAV